VAGIEILQNSAIRALVNYIGFNSKLAKSAMSNSQYTKLGKQIDEIAAKIPFLINTKSEQFFREHHYQLSLFISTIKDSKSVA
jgi:hypothetical protein